MQKEKQKRPFITVKEAIIASAIIILTAVAFEKPTPFFDTTSHSPTRYVLSQEAEIFAKQIADISASQIITSTELADGKPTLIVIYASWCIYCKKLLPNIFSLKDEGKIDNTHIIFLSVDKDRKKLATYLLEHDYNKIFTPYILRADEEKILKDIVTSKGGVYTRTIPYSLFFDGKGKLIKEILGAMSKEQILSNINEDSLQPKNE